MTKEMVSITQDEWEVFKGILNKVNLAVELESEEPKEDESWEDESCECVSCEGESEEIVEIPLEDWEDISEAFHGLQEELKETEEALEEIVKRVEDDKCLDEKLEETLLEDGRIIYLHDEINQESAMHVTTLIHYFNEVDNKLGLEKEERVPIRIHISSPGGEVFKGFGIVSAIENSKTPVHTYSEGTQLMSMGFVIFLAGEKRFMSKHSNPMYHQISSGSIGSISSMDNDVVYYKRLQKKSSDYILERTEIPESKLKYYDERNVDWHLSIDECKEYKVLTDEI